ncbi:MAG: hypothetical protein CO183_02720 [Candidatus Zambryskibacteria bacterium CG_4_9_14_3_um_filter_42_9]|nr:MAG: hypothetical protein CO183_02720 [Candidatus Zambryskibacteria bacterium CG_4_9_14_3_um_filter_42_9]
MYYTYILRSNKDKCWYTGATSDLRKRFNRASQEPFLRKFTTSNGLIRAYERIGKPKRYMV